MPEMSATNVQDPSLAVAVGVTPAPAVVSPEAAVGVVAPAPVAPLAQPALPLARRSWLFPAGYLVAALAYGLIFFLPRFRSPVLQKFALIGLIVVLSGGAALVLAAVVRDVLRDRP
jgi:hypothetical protein